MTRRRHVGPLVVALAALVAVAWCAPGPVAWAGVAALYPTTAAIARRLP
jgi:hypothetical protein